MMVNISQGNATGLENLCLVLHLCGTIFNVLNYSWHFSLCFIFHKRPQLFLKQHIKCIFILISFLMRQKVNIKPPNIEKVTFNEVLKPKYP